MANLLTQSQYNTSIQTIRNTSIRVELLNFDMITLGDITGQVISGSVQNDSNTDIRRTCNISMVVTDNSLNVEAGGKIFLDRMIRILVGVDDIIAGETAWTNIGVFMINQPTYAYDATTHTLSFEGVDLMARLTGMRYGYIAGLASEDIALVQTGQNVREVIIGILKQCGIKKYVVSECYNVNGQIQDVPYDMEYAQGSTWYDVLSEVRNILPQYQIYFDVDGVFHYELIPSSANDPVLMQMEVFKNNVISEQVSVDFESVKNSIEVYGVTHETEYFSDSSISTVNGNVVTLTVSSEATQADYQMISFVLPSDASGNITINVNSWGEYPLVDDSGNQMTSLAKDTYWVIYYLNSQWVFAGHLQAQGTYEDNNPESPFYVGGSIGKIVLPLYGGEYENIYTDSLAEQRARWEIYQRCRLNDTIQLTTVPIYWADVNWKVEYAPLGGETVNQYIVKSVYTDLAANGNQTWELSRFYPHYPVIS